MAIGPVLRLVDRRFPIRRSFAVPQSDSCLLAGNPFNRRRSRLSSSWCQMSPRSRALWRPGDKRGRRRGARSISFAGSLLIFPIGRSIESVGGRGQLKLSSKRDYLGRVWGEGTRTEPLKAAEILDFLTS